MSSTKAQKRGKILAVRFNQIEFDKLAALSSEYGVSLSEAYRHVSPEKTRDVQ